MHLTRPEGAIQTPQLLELSGIGDSDILNQFGITPIIDLPGVGENLQVEVDLLSKPISTNPHPGPFACFFRLPSQGSCSCYLGYVLDICFFPQYSSFFYRSVPFQ